jgi:hypothetical protein
MAVGACDGDAREQDDAGGGQTAGVESAGGVDDSGGSDSTGGLGTDGNATTSGGAEDDGGSSGSSTPVKFDFGSIPDAPDVLFCGAPSPVTCDDMDDDPWHAIGLNCPGGPSVDGTYAGHDAALHVHTGNLGAFDPPPFPPREGNKMVFLSTGRAADLTVPGLFTDTSHPGNDPGNTLPAPIQTNRVSNSETCTDNPGLAGTGDCSNTIQDQWDQGTGANDYAELRLTTEVPAGTFGFSYDLAMFSTEYPDYYQTTFNDMYIAWLESEQWTGNVSFDELGNPISLNAGFLDYKDAPNPFDCPPPCAAPELQGTAMQGHAGTKWLTTTAPVTPGEQITLVFAVFDLTDNRLDTVVMLDNWQWTCEGGPPITIPG